MHSRTSTKLSNRIYKKWVERFRMPFHVGVGIVCIFLYLILSNIKTAVPPVAALWLLLLLLCSGIITGYIGSLIPVVI